MGKLRSPTRKHRARRFFDERMRAYRQTDDENPLKGIAMLVDFAESEIALAQGGYVAHADFVAGLRRALTHIAAARVGGLNGSASTILDRVRDSIESEIENGPATSVAMREGEEPARETRRPSVGDLVEVLSMGAWRSAVVEEVYDNSMVVSMGKLRPTIKLKADDLTSDHWRFPSSPPAPEGGERGCDGEREPGSALCHDCQHMGTSDACDEHGRPLLIDGKPAPEESGTVPAIRWVECKPEEAVWQNPDGTWQGACIYGHGARRWIYMTDGYKTRTMAEASCQRMGTPVRPSTQRRWLRS